MKIAVIGKGHVGTAIAKGLSGKHEIKFGHRDPSEPVEVAAKWGEVIVLAVPHGAAADVAGKLDSATDGKVVVDVSNAVTEQDELALGFTTSAAEEIQKMLPRARVVKAFNTVFAQNQSTARVGGETLTLFVAADDVGAKLVVTQLGRDIGFDVVDAGSLKAARYLEPLGILMINLAFDLGMSANIGLKLVRG